MVVAETFASLQGEGMLAGMPSFFIRTCGCNLRCQWCDTPYASWHPEGEHLSVEELRGRAAAAGLRHVVITGGEPLLQREIGDLTRMLREAGHHITVETAGTLAPAFGCDLLSLSPKTSNSDPDGGWEERHRRARLELAPLRKLVASFPEHQLKFVVQDRSDLPEVLDLVATLGVWRERVFLMPEGRSQQELDRRGPEIARICLEHGVRYSPRLHFDLFGGARGC